MITTTKGLMHESDLIKNTIKIDNENEETNVIEYFLDDECVHRSVHIRLKSTVVSESLANNI